MLQVHDLFRVRPLLLQVIAGQDRRELLLYSRPFEHMLYKGTRQICVIFVRLYIRPGVADRYVRW